VVKQLAAEREMRVVKVNDDNQPLAAPLNVKSVPTLLLSHGGREVQRISGAVTKERPARWMPSWPLDPRAAGCATARPGGLSRLA